MGATKQPEGARVLRVALVGAPNAGKSTLLNKLTQSVISAVSPRAQTTRDKVLAALTKGDTQVVRGYSEDEVEREIH